MRQQVHNRFSIILTSENTTEHQIISLYRQSRSLFKSTSKMFMSCDEVKRISGNTKSDLDAVISNEQSTLHDTDTCLVFTRWKGKMEDYAITPTIPIFFSVASWALRESYCTSACKATPTKLLSHAITTINLLRPSDSNMRRYSRYTRDNKTVVPISWVKC